MLAAATCRRMHGVLETQPMTPTIVHALPGFADGAFDMVSMCAAASTVGVFDSRSDPMLVVFDQPGGGVLQLAAADETGERVGAAIAPMCGWDLASGDPVDDPERAAFDTHFDQLMAMVVATIGAADHRGIDEEHFGFRWAAWSGVTGLMALQQSWYDYCPDINIWVRPHPEGGFTPTGRFVEWLMSTP